jgi:NAD(P)-dependent dehydrogenase (short-subunit alcohol dehydrogenase family)
MNELFSVNNKVVVITGGTGVLGACIGKYLATQGAKVVLLGRRQEEGERLVSEITAEGGEAQFLACDVMNVEAVQSVCDAIVAKYGRVDALLNAAGGNMPGATIAPTGTIFDIKIEEFQRVLNVNLTGTVIPTQVFLRPMVEAGRGAIVNFSSMAAFRPMTRVLGYAAAKAGISNFTAFMANEVATKFTSGIRVNAIAPGFFLTNQNRALLTNPDGSLTPRGEDVIRQTPFKRFGKPEELCGTIQYLISDAASFVTGTVAVVDGGFNAFAM